jgi:ATP synthase protein I
VAELRGQPDKDQQDRGERQEARRPPGGSGERETEALRAQLEKLSTALDAQQKLMPPSPQVGGGPPSAGGMGGAINLAFRVMSEFVSAVMVGTAIGWGIDRLAGTSPVFLIIFLLMGAAAGFWNVYRIGTGTTGSGAG